MQGAGPANLPAHLKINLETSTILFVDANAMSLDVLCSVFYGFGAKDRIKATSIEAAKAALLAQRIDVMLLDTGFPQEGAIKLMHWLRHDTPEPVCFTPTILLAGYSTRARVRKARDAGAHFVLAKPISTGTLLNRLAWIAHEQRAFMREGGYAGPDRRRIDKGAPSGEGRRAGDEVQDLDDFAPQRASS